jgi:hypothetical protein
LILNTLLFADNKAISANNKNQLQMAINELNKFLNPFNLKTSTTKTTAMPLAGKHQV